MELTSDGKKIIVGDKRNDVILEKNQSIVKPILFLDGEEIIVRLEIRRYPVSLQETYMFVVSVYVCSEITGVLPYNLSYIVLVPSSRPMNCFCDVLLPDIFNFNLC
ncbi:MAG: hypothetical protein KAI53_01575 [Candidatus Aenigmarchaeota archaeon]|nr:hypothetical protein [Candidatus Aenigmarchaeota archaeon]